MKRSFLLAILGLLISPCYGQQSRLAGKYIKHGIELFSKGDFIAAITEYNRALALDPSLPEGYLNRSKARQAYGDIDGAIEDYEIAIQLAPRIATNNRDIINAYLNRGYSRSNQLDLDGALSDYDRAIRLNPNDAEAYFKR